MESLTTSVPGIVYEAKATLDILGINCIYPFPAPEAHDDEIVIYYGGWNLQQLRLCRAGQQHMRQDQNWYDDSGWTAEPGYYRLLLPAAESNQKTWAEQVAHLRGNRRPCAWPPLRG